MSVNSQAQEVLDEYAKLGPLPVENQTPENARQLPTMADAAQVVISKHITTRALMQIPLPVGSIEHRLILGPGGDILARIYSPPGDGPFPVLVYFHGGGWVFATLDTYDSSCRALTDVVGCIVVSVAYRQAPEHPFPAAADDAFAAYQWVLNNAASFNGNPNRVAVGGESAGGNLATVAALQARDKGVRLPVHQLLVYPVTNYAFDTPSYAEHANAKPLNAAMMRWFWGHYLSNEADGSNPYASPLQADLSGLPPATIILAEEDPLQSEGRAYADKLHQAGVPVTVTLYEGTMHEFFGMAAIIDESKKAIAEAAKALRTAFGDADR